jgi:predicted dinucleotide-binding enzyme
LAPQPVVDVRLATTKVSRGKTEKINIAASTDDVVVVTIRYRSGKPLVIKAKVGSSGTLVKTWTVPKSAPVGKASVKVVVESDGTQISKSFTFQVT